MSRRPQGVGVNSSPWWRRSKHAPAPRHTSYLSDQDVRDFARKVRHEILISLGRGNEIEPDDQGLPDPRRTWPIEQNGVPAPTPLSLDDEQVAIAGDWHGNLPWVAHIVPAMAAAEPGMRTILHTGNIGTWPGVLGRQFLTGIDRICLDAGIERILLTPGNHEDWPRITAGFSRRPGAPLQLSKTVWVLPRGYRMMIGGRTFMSFGGAGSLDKQHRIEGVSWWPDEIPTEADVAHAVTGGAVDILITHDSVDAGIPEIDDPLTRPSEWDTDVVSAATVSRQRVTTVWETVWPRLLFHGHMAAAAASPPEAPHQVVSLGCDGQPMNAVILNMSSLHWHQVGNEDSDDSSGPADQLT